ncbi:glycoside hydrolase family 71 protein [Trichocladium antarcticum]|uniref:Glycoside hydrolase family 71 protein n=1 Tax=Trichocladium antarcticum TaxID=1450529 RepID=A0AAN6UIQ8_9PEZI|nr:glycoside hydrolase family 71 protein [Trichocladium antarcticum]
MGFLSRIKDLANRHRAEEVVPESARKVFAHYMVGLTCDQSPEQWAHDVDSAKESGIDGFALNVGPSDPWTSTQLDEAYRNAEESGDFTLFISFDMAAGSWSISQVADLINRYKESTAQFKVDEAPVVSTFEGPDWADNWPEVRNQTGDIFFIPDWSSLGPHGVGQKLDLIDGAFSWDAWPKAGCERMSNFEDALYKESLQGKKYMMGVSPWFYTRLPQWDKHWYCSSESLWYDRWQQVLETLPDFVQIITWNDFGESSYICDIASEQIVSGAEDYVVGHSHSSFRAVLPYLIAAYKAGSANVDCPGEDTAVAWYRTTPAHLHENCGAAWGQGGSDSAACGARDVISIMAVTRGPASITATIGESREMTFRTHWHSWSPLSYFEMPFDSQTTGPVQITLNGKTTIGPAIGNESDHESASLNAVAIHV